MLIADVLLNGKRTDISVVDGIIKTIAPSGILPKENETIKGNGKIILPAFLNAHTHMPMSLLRGFADDMALFPWLNDRIWPTEAKLTPEQIRIGTRLAIVEMIHSGCVFFNDMYQDAAQVLLAAEELGVRAAIGRLYLEASPEGIAKNNLGNIALEEVWANSSAKNRIQLTFAPHAVYTVPEKTLRYVAEKAAESNAIIHIHSSETRKEVEDCLAQHGMTPVQWLDKCGILGPKTVLAHSVHMTKQDIEIVRERGCLCATCPNSNMKLCSGAFNWAETKERGGCLVAVATDGCASNNNLSMFDEMKCAALSAKLSSGDPTCAKAKDVLDAATIVPAEFFGTNGGYIEVGRAADLILIDPERPCMTPCHDVTANIVYSADTSCVDTVICAGRVLMQNGEIEGEKEILEEARREAEILRG